MCLLTPFSLQFYKVRILICHPRDPRDGITCTMIHMLGKCFCSRIQQQNDTTINFTCRCSSHYSTQTRTRSSSTIFFLQIWHKNSYMYAQVMHSFQKQMFNIPAVCTLCNNIIYMYMYRPLPKTGSKFPQFG